MGLLEANRTEVEHRVAVKRARARMLLERLAKELEPGEYDEMTGGRESSAEYDIVPADQRRNCPCVAEGLPGVRV